MWGWLPCNSALKHRAGNQSGARMSGKAATGSMSAGFSEDEMSETRLQNAIDKLRVALREAGIEEITVKALPRADEGLVPVRRPPSKNTLILDILREWGKASTVKEVADELIRRGAFLDGGDPYEEVSPSVTRAENVVRPLLCKLQIAGHV